LSEVVGNLPVHLSNFIGRERETKEVKKLLTHNRLVTLTGVGGSGKTRLAIQLANELLVKFRQGIWFIEFAQLADGTLVPQVVATTLGIRERKNSFSLNNLIEHLQNHQSLLIFDNCEHLINACAQLAEKLLVSCLNLQILTTSREPFSIPGEVVWVVPPMSLPELQPWRDPTSGQSALSAYQKSEAVQLFLNRATLVSPDFKLTIENGAWVAEICRRLDGMPLAIELAAARVRALSVRQIAERLDDRFNLLTGGKRTAPHRQQTLEATLDWSYALLTETERRLLQHLSVFAGSCTLEAAEVICADDDLFSDKVLDALTQLVDKSLVTVDRPEGTETRYRLLETIRHYAREKLAEAGASNPTRDRHLDYFLRWAEEAAPHLNGPDQTVWLGHFDAEHDNLRAALEWSQQSDATAALGLRLATACGYFWRLRGYLSEGRRHFSTVLTQAGAQMRTPTRARALYRAATLAYMQSDYPVTRKLGEESLAIWRELGHTDRIEVADTLDVLGELATEEGDYESAPELFKEALAIYKKNGNTQGISDMLLQLGWAAMRNGDYEQATSRLEEALTLFRELGNTAMISFGLAGLGELAIRQGFYESAASLLEESLALRQELGEKWGIGASLGSLGWVALRQGNFEQSKACLGESLAMRIEISDIGGAAWCLEKFAESALIQGQTAPTPLRSDFLRRAVCVYGTAAAIRAPVNSVIDPVDLPEYESNLATLRAALGDEVFESAWLEGNNLTLEEGIEYVFAIPESPTAKVLRVKAKAENEEIGGLTPRELETASLIALGKSNSEIAEMMTVRKKTVETYVTRILNKLGFKSRVEVATWAIEKGLKTIDTKKQ
jgi:predicted ATPase/DNA-binding CsgD family transcriptional regulator